MRYGSAKAELEGFGVEFPDASFIGVDGVPGVDVGGSIWVETAGGGRAGIASSGEEVSTVMFFVTTGDFLRVYMIGEHFIAMDGFLCPGRCAMGGLLRPARV
jgi:hypothetical protein